MEIGKLGEEIVAMWLRSHSCLILHHRWGCRWGEIDLIVRDNQSNTLIFVEVKTRKQGRNWDENGLLAVNKNKQNKMILTAESFLEKNPSLAVLNCRFDVALVTCVQTKESNDNNVINNFNLRENVSYQGYQFKIEEYIYHAFEVL